MINLRQVHRQLDFYHTRLYTYINLYTKGAHKNLQNYVKILHVHQLRKTTIIVNNISYMYLAISFKESLG